MLAHQPKKASQLHVSSPDVGSSIAASAIEHDADARSQFEHLLSRLSDEENQRVTQGALEAMVQAEGGELMRRLPADPVGVVYQAAFAGSA
jgi:hypothetical protein